MIKLCVNNESIANEAAELCRAFYPAETVDITGNGKCEEYLFEMTCEWKNDEWHVQLFAEQKHFALVSERVCQQEQEDVILYKRRVKNALKKAVYNVLKDFSGKTLPYGMLTGVRPLTLALRYMSTLEDNNNTEQKTAQFLTSEYDISPKKAQLLSRTAQVQSTCLPKDDDVSLYIHIPFCATRCNYCSFPSELMSRAESYIDSYMDTLEKEVRFIMQNAKGNFEALYVGGGTPTALPERCFERLTALCKEAVASLKINEFTLEAGRPDTINVKKLELMKLAGVTRISINPQTMNDKTLEAIGRRHTSEDIIKTYCLARDMGFDNINMDLILGLSSETADDARRTFDKVLEMAPDGITVHVLARKHASDLNRDGADIFSGMEEMALVGDEYSDVFMKNGYFPYYLYRQKYMIGGLENVGYCKDGCICRYNIRMMDDNSTCWAAGAGSVSKRCYSGTTRIERVADPKNAVEYINRIDEFLEKKLQIMK